MLLLLLAATFATGVGFIVAIVGNLESGVTLHEIAASVLLVLLLLAFGVAWRLRAIDPRPMHRVSIALIALVIAAGIGATLAVGSVPGAWTGLPLVPLSAMLLCVGDGIRVSMRRPAPRRPRDSKSASSERAP